MCHLPYWHGNINFNLLAQSHLKALPTLAALDQLQKVIESLHANNVTPTDLILSLLQDPHLQGQPSTENLVNNTTKILSAFHAHHQCSKLAMAWASQNMPNPSK